MAAILLGVAGLCVAEAAHLLAHGVGHYPSENACATMVAVSIMLMLLVGPLVSGSLAPLPMVASYSADFARLDRPPRTTSLS